MKKSNKISVFYFLSSTFLLLSLIFSGAYGIYLSVGLKFVNGNAINVADTAGRASNVSFGGSVNFESSMFGIVILSIILIVLGVFDIVSLFKQIVFFKQFKAVKNSAIEQVVEKKTKSKKSVIIIVFIIDILSVVAGIVGLFLNAKTFSGINNIWILYLVDGFVSLFALMSLVLLILKLNKLKQYSNNDFKRLDVDKKKIPILLADNEEGDKEKDNFDIDKIEYSLLKLKYLKSNKFINGEEFESLRKKIVGSEKVRGVDGYQEKNKAD